jgi:two-component system chemotaxis response regulator CheB
MKEPVRVLVVDDSALMRKLIAELLARDPQIQVAGTALDGDFALKKIGELKPDVVTLDLEMPRMSGMETLRYITRHHRLPVIVVSSHSTQGAIATFKALSLGAFDFVAKPRDAAPDHMDEIAVELIGNETIPEKRRAATPRPRQAAPPRKIVAVGVSTGGPNAVQSVLSQLPAEFPGAIVIVQHMPAGFTELFAERLDEVCKIEVKEARSGDLLLAGRALVCPGDRHIIVKRNAGGDMVVLTDEARVNGHRPSVDVLLRSVAAEFGANGIGVLMTGMGEDGAEGLGELKRAGGLTIAQSEESCVVFGMPKVAIERGHAQRIVSLEMLAHTLMAQCREEAEPARAGAHPGQPAVAPAGSSGFATAGRMNPMPQFPALLRSKDRQPVRYLVVDDSVFARRNLTKMIEDFGGQVAGEAGDGCTAITEYDRSQPDIVLMDITMPQMEGIEAVDRIVRQHPEARVVMVSSVGYQENIVTSLQKGARHFVQKPVKPEVLYEVIKYVMGDDALAEAKSVAAGGASV